MQEEKKQLSGFDEIIINHKAHSRNLIDKIHWAKKHQLKGQFRLLIRNQMKINKIKETDKKCSIKITCYLKRLIDLDNLWGGLKQFIDALCKENFIYDDSPVWLDIKNIEQIKSDQFKIKVVREILN